MESCLGDLKKQMQCSLCKDTLIEPKLVQCFHVFCKLCIKRSVEVDQQDYIFKCPHCDSQTLLQDLNDVEDLQISPVHSRILKVLEFVDSQKICSVSLGHPEASWQCLDCDQSICEECLSWHSKFTKNHQIVSLSDLNKQDIDKLLNREPLCKKHDNQSVEFWCEDCDMPICLLCIREHNKHQTISLQETIAVEKDFLTEKVKQIEGINTNEKDKKQQKEIALAIKKYGENAKQQVKEFTEKLIKTLSNNEQRLLNEIQESITKAEKNLRIISHTTQAQEYIKYLMENGTASEMIDRCQHKSSQNFTFDAFDQTIRGILFKPNEELVQQVKHGLGLVQSLKKVDPKMTSVKVVSSIRLEATKKAELVIEMRTTEEEVGYEPLENVVVQLTPENDVRVGEMQMTEDGNIVVEFTPRVAGELTADVKVCGKPVCNSPLVMRVNPQQINIITRHSKLKDALNTGSKHFSGIAVNKTNSRIAVADWVSCCVRIFTIEGDLLLTYGSKGSEQEQLKKPHGIAFLNETDLVIADFSNHRICIVNTTTGQLVRAFGCQGSGNGQFNLPRGVDVDNDSNILICDYGNSRVQVFTRNGGYLYHFNTPNPQNVVKQDGLFYVSDINKSVVNVIEMTDNQSPTIVTTIDSKGQPWGLAIDNDSNLLVCCNDVCLIRKFTLDGGYVGQSTKLTHKPWYIAVLNDGQVISATYGGGVVFLDN